MAKYAKTGRFMKQDFPGAPSWLDSFIQLLNKYKDQVEQLLDGRLTISDNVNGGIYDLNLDTAGAVANVIPVTFKFTKGKPRVVLCGGCWDITAEEFSVATPAFGWTWDSDTITIDTISGLSADRKYKLTFLVLVE